MQKYIVTAEWLIEAESKESAESMVEEAVAKHVEKSELNFCDAEEE